MVPLGQLSKSPLGNKLVVSSKKSTMPARMGVQGLATRPVGGPVVHVKRREIIIDNQHLEADPEDLMTIIRSLTQEIGDLKRQDNLIGHYKVSALRTARQAVVSDLKKFGIHWEIDKVTGESAFWM